MSFILYVYSTMNRLNVQFYRVVKFNSCAFNHSLSVNKSPCCTVQMCGTRIVCLLLTQCFPSVNQFRFSTMDSAAPSHTHLFRNKQNCLLLAPGLEKMDGTLFIIKSIPMPSLEDKQFRLMSQLFSLVQKDWKPISQMTIWINEQQSANCKHDLTSWNISKQRQIL